MQDSTSTVSTQETRRHSRLTKFVCCVVGFTVGHFAYQWASGQQAWDQAFNDTVSNVIGLIAAFVVLAPRR